MSDLHNINDHMARSCECGCVRFNLLRSGAIECDGCQQKQKNLNWSEGMDLNYKPDQKVEFSAEDLGKGKAIIRSAINNTQQCFWPDIVSESKGSLPEEVLIDASKDMQRNKEIRLREDSHEHAMEYILV